MTHAPPQDLAAERSVLAAMMLGPEAIAAASHRLTRRSFYRTAHGLVFDAVVALDAKRQAVDLVSVSAELKRRGDLEAAGGDSGLAGIMEWATTAANVETHVELVLAAEQRRELAAVGRALELAAETAEDPVALSSEIAERLRGYSATSNAKRGLLEAVERADSLTADDLPRPKALLADGLICSGDLALFAGQPGLGKSRLALELGVAMAHGRTWMGLPTSDRPLRVVYLALEFSNYRWLERCVQIFGDGSIYGESAELLEGFRGLKLAGDGGAFHWITRQQLEGGLDLVSAAGALSFRHMIESLKADIVIADALSRCMGNREETAVEVGALTSRMDDIRYSTDCAIMFVHHEKKVDDRSKADRLSLVRGSTRFTTDVNVVITCERTPSGLRAVNFAKANYAREPEAIYYEIPDEGGLTLLRSAPEKKADAKIENVWNALRSFPGGATAELIAEKSGVSLRSTRRHLERLRERGVRRVKMESERGGQEWSWEIVEA